MPQHAAMSPQTDSHSQRGRCAAHRGGLGHIIRQKVGHGQCNDVISRGNQKVVGLGEGRRAILKNNKRKKRVALQPFLKKARKAPSVNVQQPTAARQGLVSSSPPKCKAKRYILSRSPTGVDVHMGPIPGLHCQGQTCKCELNFSSRSQNSSQSFFTAFSSKVAPSSGGGISSASTAGSAAAGAAGAAGTGAGLGGVGFGTGTGAGVGAGVGLIVTGGFGAAGGASAPGATRRMSRFL